MLFEKVITTTPLISYSDVTQIAAIGGVLIFFGIIAMVVDEFNPLYLLKYYRYENVNLSRLKRNIFKLDYEDFFEKATLTNENGVVIQISKEDYEFLESINKDSEV